MLLKSESSVQKEMDLRKFIFRMRLSMNAILALLTGPQTFLIDRMSRMVVRESSNSEETSDYEALDDVQRDQLGHRIEQMAKSNKIVDKRLMDLYIVNHA